MIATARGLSALSETGLPSWLASSVSGAGSPGASGVTKDAGGIVATVSSGAEPVFSIAESQALVLPDHQLRGDEVAAGFAVEQPGVPDLERHRHARHEVLDVAVLDEDFVGFRAKREDLATQFVLPRRLAGAAGKSCAKGRHDESDSG